MIKPFLSAILLLLFSTSFVYAQGHPHILVKETDKQDIIDKIDRCLWAKTIFLDMQDKLSFYVDKHEKEPTWILDRYLMNRVPGKRYTQFLSDEEGTRLIGYSGDAPVPTVRVSSHKRVPVTPQGEAYIVPGIKDLIPNDTSMLMSLMNPSTRQYERIDPQRIIGLVNQSINELAYTAAVVYWLTGEEKYARFGADILNQWVTGAAWQEPITGPGRVGFLDIQTLGDEESKPLILAYDFLYTYLSSRHYPLDKYDVVFEKIASTLAFRGYTSNNWYAAESSTLVAAALALSDKQKQAYYLDFYLNRDTVKNGCGQLSLPTTVKKWFTSDGHWKEPGGYHNYPVSKLIESALILENNGYRIFDKYPELLNAAYVMLKYAFPDLTDSSFGDTGRPRQDIHCLEAGIKMADRYRLPVLNDLVNAMHLLQDKKQYNRSQSGITGLLCYLPELPEVQPCTSELWHRTGILDFASFFLQRNGMDQQNGLMCALQGASYNHNHANGMAMELYGKGTVMGIDPGNGPTYEHPMHVHYYTQWAAHNTVVAGGTSSPFKPFHGGGGMKEMGAVKLLAMEPLAGREAVSDNFSFTSTVYYDESTQTNQQRVMSVVRSGSKSGYYLDIYYSDNHESNDYLYHNIGEKVDFYTFTGELIPTRLLESYPIQKEDKPGLRFFKKVETADRYSGSLMALFSVDQLKSGVAGMKMWMPASPGKLYYKAEAPASKTACAPYNRMPTPVVAIRQEGPAVKAPFVVVYEPTEGGLDGNIRSVKQISAGIESAQIVLIESEGSLNQTVFHSPEQHQVQWGNLLFEGEFGIISEKPGENSLYLGRGCALENEAFRLETMNEIQGSASLNYTPVSLTITANQGVRLVIKDKKVVRRLPLAGKGWTIEKRKSHCVLSFSSGSYKIDMN